MLSSVLIVFVSFNSFSIESHINFSVILLGMDIGLTGLKVIPFALLNIDTLARLQDLPCYPEVY